MSVKVRLISREVAEFLWIVCTAIIEDYNAAMKELPSRLLRGLFNNLGVYPKEYEKYAPKEPPNLRLNHYPPCPPSKAVGLQPHKDSDLFTVLLQAGTVRGFQVLNNDQWILLDPEPEAFTVNIGTVLQVRSWFRIFSCVHGHCCPN